MWILSCRRLEIEGGVAESVGAFDVGPARRRRRGSWGGSKGGAWFYGQVRLRGFGNGVAHESTRHVTAFCHARLGNPRCYCTSQKRKVTLNGLTMLNCWLTAPTDAPRLPKKSSHKITPPGKRGNCSTCVDLFLQILVTLRDSDGSFHSPPRVQVQPTLKEEAPLDRVLFRHTGRRILRQILISGAFIWQTA